MLQIDEIGTVGERISQLITHFASGNKTAFGRAAGLQSGLLAGIIGSRQSKPSFEVLQKILTGYPAVNPTWLLFGRGEMLENQKPKPTFAEAHPYSKVNNGVATIAGLPVGGPEYWAEREKEWEQYQREKAQHERVLNVLRAFLEYQAKTDSSPEMRGIMDMLQVALNPPVAPDAVDEEREEDARQQGEWEEKEHRWRQQEG